jgi:hypothetical protein
MTLDKFTVRQTGSNLADKTTFQIEMNRCGDLKCTIQKLKKRLQSCEIRGGTVDADC